MRTRKRIEPGTAARDRLLAAAYSLFTRHGVRPVGIDAILTRAGCAKASLYNNFRSKAALALAVLERREELWTRGWLEPQIRRRSQSAPGRLLAIFDVFDGWFHRGDFEGCSFMNVLLESEAGGTIRRAAARHLARIRSLVHSLAREARLAAPGRFAQVWHMMMQGAIVAACEGNRNAAREAKAAAKLIIAGWPRSG